MATENSKSRGLIIEDSKTMSRFIARMIHDIHSDWATDWAMSAEDALEKVDTIGKYSLITVDINMQ